MLPRDRGDGAIGADLARNRFGNCCGLLPNCLHVYLLLLSLTLLGHSLCGGAGPPRLLDVLWCVCVRIQATCPCGHRMSGSAHPLQPPRRCNPHTSVAGRGALGSPFFRIAGSCRKSEPWPVLPGRTFFPLLLRCQAAPNCDCSMFSVWRARNSGWVHHPKV